MTITKNQCTRIYKHMRKLAESEERERYDKYTDVAFWLHNATEDLTIDVTLMKVKC